MRLMRAAMAVSVLMLLSCESDEATDPIETADSAILRSGGAIRTTGNSHEVLLQALADLLLEALGEKVAEVDDEQGDACEHKDHG